MFNKMLKLRSRKAFTLIEMMAVVAIVAILVAILVPVIGNATTKSRAATNAANLRAVESELATLKVSHPECFVAATSESPGSIFSYLADILVGAGAGQYYLSKIEASDDGTLTFWENQLGKSGNSVSKYGAPTAVAVQADDGMDVTEGTKMVVYISGDEIIAAYLGKDGTVFDKDCFAEVAETGKFTGETGAPSGGVIDTLKCLAGDHDWSKKDGVCARCGKVCKHEDAFGNSWWSNGVCQKCGKNCSDHNKTNDGNAETHHCTNCGAREDHTWEPDNTFSKILSALGIESTTTGKCACGYEHAHTYQYIAINYHYCSGCGHLDKCSFDATTGKCVCGQQHGTCYGWSEKDGACRWCGCAKSEHEYKCSGFTGTHNNNSSKCNGCKQRWKDHNNGGEITYTDKCKHSK